MNKRFSFLFVCFLMLAALVACGGTKVLPQSSEQSLAQSPSGSKMANEMGSMIDPRDGQIYKTVKIGNQVWMAENLNYETKKRIASFRGGMSGDDVFYYETFTSSCYEDRFSNCTRYGRLYKWPEVLDACPTGWHLPSHAEWDTLFLTVGGKDSAGKVLKSVDGWFDDGNGTDSYGFSAIPMGYRGYAHFVYYYGEGTSEDYYINEGRNASFWSSTELDSSSAYGVYMFYYKSKAEIVPDYKRLGLAIRCVKDSALEPDSGTHSITSGQAPAGMTEKAISSSSSRVTLSRVEGSLLDSRDGQTYRTVSIGSQTWMAQNLNYATANSYCYKDVADSCAKYGRFYTWAAAMDSVYILRTSGYECGFDRECSMIKQVQGVCPNDWHLPTQEDWLDLIKEVGGASKANNVLKSKTGWLGIGNGTDDFGFAALPAGDKDLDDRFLIGNDAAFWSSTGGTLNAYYMGLEHNKVNVESISKVRGLSVRCVKNVDGGENGRSPLSFRKNPFEHMLVRPDSVVVGSFTDSRDGQTYGTVMIGSQTWMSENLNYDTGDSFCSDKENSCNKYHGCCYKWNEANDACPAGWRLPTEADWDTLFESVGGKAGQGTCLSLQLVGTGRVRDILIMLAILVQSIHAVMALINMGFL